MMAITKKLAVNTGRKYWITSGHETGKDWGGHDEIEVHGCVGGG